MRSYSVTVLVFLVSLVPFVLCAPSKQAHARTLSKLWDENNSDTEGNTVGKRAVEDGEDKFWKRGEDLEGFWKRSGGDNEITELLQNLREYLAHRGEAKRGYENRNQLQKAERRRQEAAMIRPEFNPTGW
ncbi:hypothetical protein CAPTEDRAFT_185330 [Capitella teleta]|uniref:Uncharacterized protein n=1 Tax=Capitella teleta TaxID=283909 RepID=R7T3X9_CAPTE|nr:hypothetical protein CAPTEDRAFT_185330 [Capitella teleta]|eukprot:ELT87552.1 hypothetical protein CAPTEDRAFT_185330 [Capitella teleta]